MFPCFRVLIILYMNPWKSQVAQATLIHVCMENILHPKKCSLSDTLHALQLRRRPDLPRAPCLASSADRCSASSVRACVPCTVCCGRSALHLARPVLLPVLCSPSGYAGVGGGTPAGHIVAAQPRPVSPVTTEKNKKGSKTTPPSLPILKISRKNKKTPTKGLCSVLYLPYKP